MQESRESKRMSRQRYSKYAQGYITSETHAKGADLDRVVEVAQPQPHWLVLDVATGGGHTALNLAPNVAHVVAVDLTPEMLKAAKEHVSAKGVKNISFELADAEDVPFKNDAFDLVTCRIAPHHFPNAFQFVQESTRVLKSGGVLVVQDHVLPEDGRTAHYVDAFERLRDPSHNRAFSEPEWRQMFENTGLAVAHAEKIAKRHAFISWAERQGCSRDCIDRLEKMIEEAPRAAFQWMQPRDFGTPKATFANRHIIIVGRKIRRRVANPGCAR